ncbi:hypothetical protein ACFXB3_08385 [Streptomyces sp. NPDC059447]|uniref:hypothetical protein n=1 Tax=Streptomyces sp. NPDC059447 TaxID=3346834 RepID=UPI0036839882
MADRTALARGRTALIGKCLARLGAPYDGQVGQGAPVKDNERRYGLADAELAGTSGYHLPGAHQTNQRSEEYPAPIAPLVAGEVPEYNGAAVPEGGCAGEALRELHEQEMNEPLVFAQKLNMAGYRNFQQDPAVTAVNARWSACMKESGYGYPDPLAAINDKEFSGAEPTDREKAVALTDVRCKQKVNLIGVWAATETAYQQQLIKENSAELEKGLAAKRVTMSAATAAVSGAAVSGAAAAS